jgi:1-acyl-sn-glycerol-3-phosphate acyltransferase
LPKKGPAILVANHNSHLDTLVMMTLFPLRMQNRIRPVAAADYFLKNRWMAWFSLNIMHIIPLQRKGGKKNRDLFQGIYTALDQGDLVILYPEGSRGEPERLQRYKSGIYHLARKRPDVPIHPIFMHGLGKALPKGDPILVPFFCDVFVGEPFRWQEDKQAFMEELNLRMAELAGEGDFAPWE